MNLRILKKLSKRAAELLPNIGCDLSPFPAEKNANHHAIRGMDRKHWDRSYSVHTELMRGDILVTPRHGKHWIKMREPFHPLKGTMMVGWMSGYYEPEWEEEDAWARLRGLVCDHFTDYDGYDEGTMNRPVRLRKFPNPTAVFKAVPDIIAQYQKELADRQRWEDESRARRQNAAVGIKDATV